MSDTAHSPEKEHRPAISPKARLLRKQRTRQDSERSRQSFGSGSLHRRPSYRSQSSLGLPHFDSFKSIILEPREDIEISKEGGKCIPQYKYDVVLKDIYDLPFSMKYTFGEILGIIPAKTADSKIGTQKYET